jgi:hypothetical protein
MKRLITLISLSALALALPVSSIAAEKEKTAKKPAEKAPAASAESKAEPKAAKPIPMHVRADVIDAAAKTFTNKRKDGVEVKHVLTDTTEIKNGDADAKLEDIKVGDFVSGSQIKKSETEYEVVKITKFGPAPERKAAEPKATGEPKKEKKK